MQIPAVEGVASQLNDFFVELGHSEVTKVGQILSKIRAERVVLTALVRGITQ